MRQPLQDIELIERYFDNALSPDEVHGLSERLKSDHDFQKLFDQEKLLVNTIRFAAANRDLEYLKTLERSLSGKSASPNRRRYYYLAAAACITLVALAVWGPDRHMDPETLYTAYFQPHPNIFEPVLRSEPGNSRRAQAFQAYEQKDYQTASLLFTELLAENEDAGMRMLLGNANLMLGKTEVAKENFLRVIDLSDDLDAGARWYLGLCYLRSGDTERAKGFLRDITSTDTPYAARARDLLADLD